MNDATGPTILMFAYIRYVSGQVSQPKEIRRLYIFSSRITGHRRPSPWSEVLKHRAVFLSHRAATQFRGFTEAQLRRLQGIGTGKKGQRHELIGAHGYDIKAAMHVIRLLNEGIELMRHATITLPRPEKELLITIRTGKYGSLDRVLNLANQLFVELERAERESCLPDRVDKAKVSAVISETYLRFWNRA